MQRRDFLTKIGATAAVAMPFSTGLIESANANAQDCNGWIDVPITIEAVWPHCDPISPDENPCCNRGHYPYPVKPVPNTVPMSNVYCPRAVHKIKSIEVRKLQILFRRQRRVVYIEPIRLFKHRKHLIENTEEQLAYGCRPQRFLINAWEKIVWYNCSSAEDKERDVIALIITRYSVKEGQIWY